MKKWGVYDISIPRKKNIFIPLLMSRGISILRGIAGHYTFKFP
jgi:hypothetical protein